VNIEQLGSELGFDLDKDLIETALTHSSYLNEHPGTRSNEQLAWLGDAVIYLCATEHVFNENREKNTGELTEIRKKYLNRKRQAQEAKRIKLDEFLRLSKGESDQGGRSNSKNLHTAFEALIGVIYLHKEMKFIENYIRSLGN
jgi:ribonuclease-3